jgi:23S rRNA (cytosine1962-C5)-methyltransferase
VFAGAIAEVTGNPADGAVVDLHAEGGAFVGRGLYNSQSQIRVRMFSWSQEQELDAAFFRARLADAIRLRRDLLGMNGREQACRLVYSEADGLSGCVVDRFGEWLVVQFTSLALAQRREEFSDYLMEELRPRGIYLRTERDVGKLEGLALRDGPLRGETPLGPIEIFDQGLRFLVNLKEGQKTGFYLDQRDNRLAVARFAAGRRVLDCFCYSGGFALHASRAGATQVIGVDISGPALELARANAELNRLDNVAFVREDVFAATERLIAAGERFGVVVLDPPKFARARQGVDEALRAYRRLQSAAVRLLEADGILAFCCCSGRIDAAALEQLLAEVAEKERREIQILERRGQAADHPVAVSCPESSYLKCLVCRVRG